MTQLVPITLTPSMPLYKYQLLQKIGDGSFGEVWLARDAALQREFAIKILKPNLTVDHRLKEARIGNLLSHNNLVHVYQADVVNVQGSDVVILAMDYLPSGSIEKLANPAGFLPLRPVLQIALDILQGLEHLHSRGFFHNDIKPGNILIGPQQQAMLTDYGITGVSSNGAPVAAPDAYLLHLAPEVATTGNIGVSSDIFQVGMTLARLLIHLDHLGAVWSQLGKTQFESAVATGKLLSQKDFGSHIPAAVRRIVLRAVHPNAASRFTSALEMRRSLEKLNYLGDWTVDSAGNSVGKSDHYEFSHRVLPAPGGKFEVISSKLNVVSGNVQRVTQFCKKSLTQEQANKLIANFKQFVVTGQ